MDNFGKYFGEYTQERYDYLRPKKVEITESKKTMDVYFYVREDVYEKGVDEGLTKDLNSFFAIFIKRYKLKYHFERLMLSEEGIRSAVIDHLCAKFPFVASNMFLEDIVASLNGNECHVTLPIPDSMAIYAKECRLADEVSAEFTYLYMLTVKVTLTTTDKVPEARESASAMVSTAIEVSNVRYLCGTNVGTRHPIMLEHVKEEGDNTTICGRVSGVKCYINKEEDAKPSTDGKKRKFYKYSYSFDIDDTTGSTRVFFRSNDDNCPLKDLKNVTLLVVGRAFLNRRSGAINLSAKGVFTCNINFERMEEARKPLPIPDTYRNEPQPLILSSTKQMAFSFIEEARDKTLLGTYVFWYTLMVDEGFSPYQICMVKAENGKAVSHWTSYVYNSSLERIDVEHKNKVQSAKRLGDLMPDIVKYTRGTTLVAFDAEKLMETLKDTAESMRYRMDCSFVDAGVLLKKGKVTRSLDEVLHAHKIVMDGKGAYDHAVALMQLYVDIKGV